MWNPLFLTAALALGQPGAELPDVAPPPPVPRALKAPLSLFPNASVSADTPAQAVPDQPPPDQPPTPITVNAPLLPTPKPAVVAAPAAAPPTPDWPVTHNWKFMQALQGTYYGAALDSQRIQIYGWAEMSGTISSAGVTNEPMAWNDRANRVLLQQFFVRAERPILPTAMEPTWGFRTDWLIGSDYRFTLPRGIFNGQLINSSINPLTGVPTQNLYGVDPVEFYGEVYLPFGNPAIAQQGLDIKVGRWYAPYGEESIEAVSTPLVSRSYTFNNGPEFTNTGVLATLTINPEWTVCGGYTIGNDIFFDAGMEGRFVGFVKWTQPGTLPPTGGRDTVTLATTIGRGKFNVGAPFATENPAGVTTSGIGAEALGGPFELGGSAGRNNINVVDLLYTHTFNPVLSYAAEGLVGWQYDLPPLQLPGRTDLGPIHGVGTANWYSLSQYLIYQVTPRLVATGRAEVFDDVQGSRTGFEGTYTELTAGLAFKPRILSPQNGPYYNNGGGLIIRPELRWDHNGETRAFNFPLNPSHDLYTAAIDVIVRW